MEKIGAYDQPIALSDHFWVGLIAQALDIDKNAVQ